MNLLELLQRRFDGLRHGEEVPFDADFPAGREELWLLIGEAEHLAHAARDLVEALKGEFARTLSENETVRYGDTVYKMSTERVERITDPAGLIEFLGADWHHVVPVTSSTRLKRKGIGAVCELRGVDVRTFEDTFLAVEWGDRKLAAIPIHRAPKYAQALVHGGSTFGRKA